MNRAGAITAKAISGALPLVLSLALAGPGAPPPPAPLAAGLVPGGDALGGAKARLAAAPEAKQVHLADFFVAQRSSGHGLPSARAYRRALAQRAAAQARTRAEATDFARVDWQHLGPLSFGGRIADIAVDEQMPDVVYLGTAGGGVWKSTDGGLTFESSWPARLPQAIGALAASPDGSLYAGTGEANPGGGSVTFGGAGVYVSRDGGRSWRFSGLRRAGSIGRIVVDPARPKRIYVAAAGDLFAPGGQRGLYVSDDAGRTWRRVLAGDNATTGAVDVAVSPDGKVVLAAMWDHRRLPSHRLYGGPGSGLYRTGDAGRTWQRLAPIAAPDAAQTGRIGVAFAPSDPSRAYAYVANDLSGMAVGLFRSDDAGKTWQRTAASPASLSSGGFGWWFGRLWVDPGDPDRLFVAGVEVIESLDAGDSFTAHSNTLIGVGTGAFQAGPAVHADQHAMAWDPHTPGRVYLGNDGGLYRSDANGLIGSWHAALRQGFTQHYSVDVSEQQPSRVVSGLQDNLCQRNYVAGDTGRPETWTKFGLCGDGLQTLINPDNDLVIYGCAQYGSNCTRSLDGGTTFSLLGETQGQRYGWWMPLVFDPNDPQVLYAGSNLVNRSSDGGQSWTAISPDLTTDPEQLDPNPNYRIYGTITTIAVAPSRSATIAAATDDGQLWLTGDGGESWQRLRDPKLPRLWITRVAFDPSDERVLYVTYSGFRAGSNEPHVLVTRDGGRTWDDLSGDLPDAPVNEIVVARGTLLVGTDVGVFASDRPGRWYVLGGLPAVPVFDLDYHAGSNTVTAATFGHGVQRAELPG